MVDLGLQEIVHEIDHFFLHKNNKNPAILPENAGTLDLGAHARVMALQMSYNRWRNNSVGFAYTSSTISWKRKRVKIICVGTF